MAFKEANLSSSVSEVKENSTEYVLFLFILFLFKLYLDVTLNFDYYIFKIMIGNFRLFYLEQP